MGGFAPRRAGTLLAGTVVRPMNPPSRALRSHFPSRRSPGHGPASENPARPHPPLADRKGTLVPLCYKRNILL